MSKTEFVTDSLGRQLEIKPMGITDQFDLLEAAQNQAEYKRWFGLASLVFCCVSVDGIPLPTPRNPADFKKNSAILKDEGVTAIAEYFTEKMSDNTDVAAEVEAAKN